MSRPIQRFSAVALALLASLAMALSLLTISPARAAQAASAFTCTEVIGFSQTNNWFTEGGTFEPLVGDANWQERWYSGGRIDLWSNPDGAPWFASVLSNCASGGAAPDRVLINISGAYSSDPNWWQSQIQGVIGAIANNSGHGYSNN